MFARNGFSHEHLITTNRKAINHDYYKLYIDYQ